MREIRVARFMGACLLAISLSWSVNAQTIGKYGSAFLETGVGARALGMGGTAVAMANDVTAGYWNVAGLSRIEYPQAAYMHSERFGGIVSFDYGGIAFPINNRSTFGISFFRSGVNDIPSTLSAWDNLRDQPLPRPENHISPFSAADYAFFVGYARSLSPNLAFGVTGKVVRRSIGDFSRAWGYSFDLGIQYHVGRLMLGANLQDASTMLMSWSVNKEKLSPIETLYEQELPEGGSELYLPVARLGSAYDIPLGGSASIGFGADMDLRFDGQQAYVFDAGGMSLHPRFGSEVRFKNVVALRAGIGNFTSSERYGIEFTPSVGAGLKVNQFTVDYGFGDFSGLTSELGYSHRLSVQLSLEQPQLRRVFR